MSPLILYLLTCLDGVRIFAILWLAAWTVISLILVGINLSCSQPYTEAEKRVLAFVAQKVKWVVAGLLSGATVLILIPTRQDIALILVGNWVTNSEEMNQLPENATRVLNRFMEEYAPKDKDKK